MATMTVPAIEKPGFRKEHLGSMRKSVPKIGT
jgi:hypothetical protein